MPGEAIRGTWATVDLPALAGNLERLRAWVHPAAVLPVVKADAYGHGAIPVARHLEAQGADGFCVALVEEGLALREAGIAAPILVLNGAFGRAHRTLLEAELTPVVYRAEDLRAFARAARALGRTAEVHLKVDTGLGRLGVPHEDLTAFLDELAGLPDVRLTGLMTHLASAGEDAEASALQHRRFDAARARVARFGHRPAQVHAGNGAAALGEPWTHLDAVRVGLALYGVRPVEGLSPAVHLEPVLSLRTEVLRVHTIAPGESVGYGRTFRARAPTRVATLAVGYGDGVPWRLGGRGSVLLGGEACPLVGRVSMDLLGVDVGHLPACDVGDEAVLLGAQGEARIGAEDVAAWAGTIPYEVLTRLTMRVPRHYRDGAKKAARTQSDR